MVSILVTNTVATKAGDGGSNKGSDKRDGEKLSKWALKKKKLPCYRCGEPGHFVAECTTELCDYVVDRSMCLVSARSFQAPSRWSIFMGFAVRS